MHEAHLSTAPAATSTPHARLIQCALDRSARRAAAALACALGVALAASLAATLIDRSWSGIEPRGAEAAVVARPPVQPTARADAAPASRLPMPEGLARTDEDIYFHWECRDENC